MSDDIKLVIEIPKEAKQAFDNAESNDLKGGYYDLGGNIGKAIQNGKPLSEVLRDIEQEVYDLKEKCDACEYLGCGIIEIIDKYIGKAESEDK